MRSLNTNVRYYHSSPAVLEESTVDASENVNESTTTQASQSFDITSRPSFEVEKEENLQYLTLISVEEYETLSKNIDFIKADRENSPIASFRKLLHYNLGSGDVENALVHFGDLVYHETPHRFEVEYLMCLLIEARKFEELGRVYRIFKDSGLQYTEQTFDILFKGFGESGNVAAIMEIYENCFLNKIIPKIENIFQIVKCSAIGGDPKTFFRFYTRVYHKVWFHRLNHSYHY